MIVGAATAAGGKKKERAEEGIGPAVAMVAIVEAELKTAKELLAPLLNEANAENDRADAILSRTYDDT